jgi:hypothetical protein
MYVHLEPMELMKDPFDSGNAFCPGEFGYCLRR